MSWRGTVAKWLGLSPVVKYRIVEVQAPRTQVGWDKEMRETVATLSAHPGFVALLDRLKLQSSFLKSKLVGAEHKEMKDVIFLQAGIYWSDWLQQQIATATKRVVQTYKDATQEDEEAIKELSGLIERVE